jgi:hypothetical protein
MGLMFRTMGRNETADGAGFISGIDGTFKAARLSPGTNQKLTVLHPDFERRVIPGVDLVAGALKPVSVDVVLSAGFVLTGQVKDKEGSPIAEAAVALNRSMQMTGGRGGNMMTFNTIESVRPQAETDFEGKFEFDAVQTILGPFLTATHCSILPESIHSELQPKGCADMCQFGHGGLCLCPSVDSIPSLSHRNRTTGEPAVACPPTRRRGCGSARWRASCDAIASRAMILRYAPRPYPGRVTLLVPGRRHDGRHHGTSDLGWAALARGGLSVHEIACEGATLVNEPDVAGLADALRGCLHTARR